ncbi:segregation and condensation protein A [Nakamurella endophytica]|uniref:Segregation and condensation protein A n=1 Tax=Nakamurella endophytica TaxID=1748367 RepID=A0A917T8L4_9ACTN|nr:segregation/condensation protein A [Nakamurella endophytica]GGM13361.1 segregation/condensation protein A [Nakamurella endophytica]
MTRAAASLRDAPAPLQHAPEDPADAAVAGGEPTGTTGPAGRAADGQVPGFHVRLSNFEGPFDLLQQLIGARRMDVTEVALSQVTDEFLAYLADLGDRADLDVVTEFLVVAATLLDIKAARLLPQHEEDGDEDLAVLEARDLLFARLLAYRAYQQVAALFAELEAAAPRRYPRAVTLEPRYLGLLPQVRIGLSAERFAQLAVQAFAPRPVPEVSLAHIHTSTVSVADHTAAIRTLLRDREQATFGELVAECTRTLEVVARFLGLLHLYRESSVVFDQREPLGLLTVRWTGPTDEAAGDPAGDRPEEYE